MDEAPKKPALSVAQAGPGMRISSVLSFEVELRVLEQLEPGGDIAACSTIKPGFEVVFAQHVHRTAPVAKHLLILYLPQRRKSSEIEGRSLGLPYMCYTSGLRERDALWYWYG